MTVPGAAELTVVLALGIPVAAPRPRDLEVSFANGTVRLAGTLSVPGGAGRHPVAVLVSGYGSQDRDGAPGGAGLPRRIAERLVAEGIAVLRHDDRGAGSSTRPLGPPSYLASIADTRAAVAWARTRGDLDGRMILIWHSEGAKTAALLAAEDPRIVALVMRAGATAVNVDTLLMEQARAASSPHAARLLRAVEAARAGVRAGGEEDLADWLREHLEIAPRDVLPRVRCPVLILQGGRDHLVAAHHATEAAGVLRASGNHRVAVRTFPGLSHVFNRWTPGAPAPAARGAVDPAVLDALATWTREALAGGSGGGR